MAQAGDTLGGFELVEQIGHRSKGDVWRAKDRQGSEAAVRILPFGDDPQRLARFRDEIAILEELAHPNVARVLGTGEQDGVHFLATEYVAGPDLSEQPAREPARFFALAAPLASAISAANERQLIHGDVNPRSARVAADGTVKLLDLAVREMRSNEPPPDARPEDVPTETITRERELGPDTLPYCSPERVQMKPLDVRADVYSLAAVLYELATGQPPFSGETSADLIVAVLRDLPPPITEANPKLPAELDRIIGRALVKDRGKRLQATRFLAEDLERLAAEAS